MAKNDLCTWNNQWNGAYKTNPQKKDNGFVCDLVKWVSDKSQAPDDYEIIVPYPHGKGCLAIREVVIDKTEYEELLANEGK